MDAYKNHTVSIRFDPDEYRTLTALCGFTGMAKAGVIRHMLRSFGVMLGFVDAPQTRTTITQRSRRRKPDEQTS
jgi:hypothetical protein